MKIRQKYTQQTTAEKQLRRLQTTTQHMTPGAEPQ